MSRHRKQLGDVYELALGDGSFAYGRIYRDAAVAFYRARSPAPGQPPIGSRDFEFTVGVYNRDIASMRWVGRDPFAPGEDDWPRPQSSGTR